ncbi:MAG: hypothetical protein P1V20_25340 [Verrucomicrobiales bacterium]|nr:hypothetical protein [Verrucomicrobiales bacterium]
MKTSIEELDGTIWDSPLFPSEDINRYHEARKIPIDELSPEQLYLMFRQGFCREHLVYPILSALQSDVRAQGDKLLELLLNFLNHKADTISKEVISQTLDVIASYPLAELKMYDLLEMEMWHFQNQHT